MKVKFFVLMTLASSTIIKSNHIKKTQPKKLQSSVLSEKQKKIKEVIRKMSDSIQETSLKTVLATSVIGGATTTGQGFLKYPHLISKAINNWRSGTTPSPTHSLEKYAMFHLLETAIISGIFATTFLATQGLNSLARKWMNIKDTAPKPENTQTSEITEAEKEIEKII